MITRLNIREVLRHLDFAADLAGAWRKSFAPDVSLAVDFANERLIYPPEKLKIHVHTTTNFDDPENFVVFECVHRLKRPSPPPGRPSPRPPPKNRQS